VDVRRKTGSARCCELDQNEIEDDSDGREKQTHEVRCSSCRTNQEFLTVEINTQNDDKTRTIWQAATRENCFASVFFPYLSLHARV